MKKIFFILFGILSSNMSYGAGISKDDLYPSGNTIGISGDGLDPLNQVVSYGKSFFFTILGIIVVGMFIYYGYVLITTKGNEEEYKKALTGFLYVVVGLAIIPLSLGLIKIITSLNL